MIEEGGYILLVPTGPWHIHLHRVTWHNKGDAQDDDEDLDDDVDDVDDDVDDVVDDVDDDVDDDDNDLEIVHCKCRSHRK